MHETAQQPAHVAARQRLHPSALSAPSLSSSWSLKNCLRLANPRQ